MVFSIFITQPWMFLIVMTFFSAGSGLSRPLLVGSVSKLASPKEQGAVMGVTNSLGSVAQIIGPLVGGAIINYFFPGCLGLVAAIIVVAGIVLMLTENKKPVYV